MLRGYVDRVRCLHVRVSMCTVVDLQGGNIGERYAAVDNVYLMLGQVHAHGHCRRERDAGAVGDRRVEDNSMREEWGVIIE